MDLIDSVIVLGALALSLGGILLIWSAWRERRWGPRAWAAIGFWIGSAGLWIARFGAEIGIPLALETAALAGFAFILSRMERRVARTPREREVPPLPASRYRRLRGAAKFLIAGPIGMFAAMGIAFVVATGAPLAEQTRLILAGLIVPSLWAVFIGWTVADRRLGVPAAILLAIGGAGFGFTMIPRA
ncbi:hypothetical protein [Sphingomonas sp. dw_22]|uniref:hypothetical protein n=1 Tax=Sphingomonas sp. dw_22 TaxID=2721175 RepID=UPI001BD1CD5F|nr:hypothetical protein [Sphingomonas sp. dw_22]